MPLLFYNSSAFGSQSALNPVDLFTAPGSTNTFTLVNNTVATLGATIQAGATEYYQGNGGFTTNAASGTFTLAQTPPVGTQIVAPGANKLTISAFDQSTVLGVSNPRVQQTAFWMMDISSIRYYEYNPLPSYPGIFVNAVQCINGVGAQTSWIQFACADASGNSMTYGATGAPLYLPAITAVTTLSTTLTAQVSSLLGLQVTSASSFIPGAYVVINVGNVTQEVLHIISVDSVDNILYTDTGGTSYTHYAGEYIYLSGFKAFMQLTIPVNANNGGAINLYNLGLLRLGAISARP